MPAKSWLDEQINNALHNGIKKVVSAFSLFDTPCTQQNEFPLQRHHNREILIVMYGESDFALEGHKVHLEPGTAVLIDRWQQHSAYYREQDSHLIHIWMHFLSFEATAYFDYITAPAPGNKSRMLSCGKFSFSEAFTQTFLARWQKANAMAAAGKNEKADEYMKTIIQFALEEILIDYALPEKTEHPADKEQKVSFARNYIDSHNGKDCSLDRLAMISNCSKYHLVHLFRECTGKTPGDFINEARIRYTKAALSYGLRKKEIADNLGFASPSAFGNWEKKFMK